MPSVACWFCRIYALTCTCASAAHTHHTHPQLTTLQHHRREVSLASVHSHLTSIHLHLSLFNFNGSLQGDAKVGVLYMPAICSARCLNGLCACLKSQTAKVQQLHGSHLVLGVASQGVGWQRLFRSNELAHSLFSSSLSVRVVSDSTQLPECFAGSAATGVQLHVPYRQCTGSTVEGIDFELTNQLYYGPALASWLWQVVWHYAYHGVHNVAQCCVCCILHSTLLS